MKFRLRRPYRHYSPKRSLLPTGCLFAILAFAAAMLLFAFTDLRALAVQALPQIAATPAAQSAPELPLDPEDPAEPRPTAEQAALTTPRGVVTAPPTRQVSASTRTPTAEATPTLPAALRPSPSVAVSDLVFLADGRLQRWERRTNVIQTLAEDVADYTLSTDSRVALVLHPHQVTVNGQEVFTLSRLDLASGEESTLLAEMPRPQHWALSPTGTRVAYVLLTGSQKQIFLLDSPEAPQALRECAEAWEGACAAPAWSPDGKRLAWSDSRGLWMVEPASANVPVESDQPTAISGQTTITPTLTVAPTATPQPTPRPTATGQPIAASGQPTAVVSPQPGEPWLAHDNQVQVVDPEGQTSSYAAAFSDLRWSEDGRFILVRIHPKASAISWQGVLDVRRGFLASIPDSYISSEAPAIVAWLSEDEVMSANASDLLRGTPPRLHVWNVFATNPDLLVPGEQYEMYSDDFPFSPEASKSIPVHHLDWLAPGGPGKVLVGVQLPDTETQPVIFALDLATGKLQKLLAVPPAVRQMWWSPDGSGALAGAPGGPYYFLTLTGEGPVELDELLPSGASDPAWLAASLPTKSGR